MIVGLGSTSPNFGWSPSPSRSIGDIMDHRRLGGMGRSPGPFIL